MVPGEVLNVMAISRNRAARPGPINEILTRMLAAEAIIDGFSRKGGLNTADE
jgi:hypothetical protein